MLDISYTDQQLKIICMTEESMETLNASFDATDWDIFVNNAEDK